MRQIPSSLFSILATSGLLAVCLLGCGGEKAETSKTDNAQAKAQTAAEAKKRALAEERKRQEAVQEQKDEWSRLVTQLETALAESDLDALDATLAKLNAVYASPTAEPPANEPGQSGEGPSQEQQDQLTKLEPQIAKLRREKAGQQRDANLATAKKLMDDGDLKAATERVNAVLDAAPTADQRQAANKIAAEIERRRGARSRLRNSMAMLGSTRRGEVTQAQRELYEDAETAMPLLFDALATTDKPVLVKNTLEMLRKLKRPEIVLPKMFSVLEKDDLKPNWEVAIREIVRLEAPGAGPLALGLAKSSDNAEQKIAALELLGQVVDPPADTVPALLPMIYSDGPELAVALEAALHAMRVHEQFDLPARRGLDVEVSAEMQQQLLGLPARLKEIIAASSDSEQPDPAARAARVVALATRTMPPAPLEGVKLLSFKAETEESPAAAVLDGVWNSVEPNTMWRYPVGQPGQIILDLGAERSVAGVRIWNHNEPSYTTRGWKEVDIYVYTDTTSPEALAPHTTGIIPVAPGAAETPDYGTMVPVEYARGRYVKLRAKSLWTENTHTGLAEIQVVGF